MLNRNRANRVWDNSVIPDIFSLFPDIVRECPERGHRVRIKLDQGRPHGSPVKFPSSLVKFPSLHLIGLCQIGHAGPALAKCLDL